VYAYSVGVQCMSIVYEYRVRVRVLGCQYINCKRIISPWCQLSRVIVMLSSRRPEHQE
jgi:hypothetical protein